jgi:hypothetical protein
MDDLKKKMLVATLSQCYADRDKIIFIISSILENGHSESKDNVVSLKKEFEKLSQIEATIDTIQLYFAKITTTLEQDAINNTPTKGE